MNWRPNRNLRTVALTAFVVIAASMMFYFLIFRTTTLGVAVGKVLTVLKPVIYGFTIAYVLNPIMILFEKAVYKVMFRLGVAPGPKFKNGVRFACTAASVLVMIALIYGIISSVLPQLIHSIRSIIRNYHTYAENISNFFDKIFANTDLDEVTKEMIERVMSAFETWYESDFTPHLNAVAGSLTSGVVDLLTFMKNMLLGLIISSYLLISKESMIARFRRAVYAFLPIRNANRLLHTLRFADQKFGGFVIGKVIDSVIIGIICHIMCLILRMPYATLISVIVGVTNIIPFFGPFIGAIPCTVLIFVVNPLKSLIFVIMILLIQQLDGNLIGPKILGDSVGVSSYMVILSILIGSGFFGITGMIIGVPVSAVLVALLQTHILRTNKKKGIPADLESYHYVRQINPITRQVENTGTDTHSDGLYDRIRFRDEDVRFYDEPITPKPWDRTYEEVEAEDNEINGTNETGGRSF